MGDSALSIFTVPKAFTGEFDLIQRNAIRSWKALGAEVFFLAEEEGVEQAAEELGVVLVRDVRRNAYNTPLLDDAFEKIDLLATTDLVAFVNADILLFDSFMKAVEVCSHILPHFYMCGQRLNTEYRGLTLEAFELMIDAQVLEGELIGVAASDYFVYRKGDFGAVPPFAIGRFRWDNWLMWRATDLGLSLVDATAPVLAVHQKHEYAHNPDGHELEYNDHLVSSMGGRLGRLTDATHYLDEQFNLHDRVKA